jgi:hypothetical protein
MASLSLKKLIQNSRKKYSDRLFHNCYRYSISIEESRVSALRGTFKLDSDDDQIQSIILARLQWQLDINYGGSWRSKLDDTSKIKIITQADRLYNLYLLLKNQNSDFKFATSRNWCYIYTNDIALVSALFNSGYSVIEFVEAVISRPLNTIKGSGKFLKRTYLKEKMLNANTVESMASFLKNQDDIELGPSFKKWLFLEKGAGRRFNYVQRHYFFDHNSDSVAQMLELITPGLIRKTVEILAK